MVRSTLDGSITEEALKGPDFYCRRHCEHKDGQAAAFHTGCYSYWGGRGHQVNEVGKVTRPDLVPIKGQVLAETAFIREEIMCSLVEHYGHRLPLEILHYVAAYLILPYSVAATLLTRPTRPQSLDVTTTSPIWAQFIKFHGRFYIASLSNTAYEDSDKTSTSTLIYSPSRASTVDAIYVAYDPWGIRNILFASSETDVNVAECTGVWWHTLALVPAVGKLSAEGDGLKLRQLVYLDGAHESVVWPSPTSPQHHFKVVRMQNSQNLLQAMPLVINGANTIGYRVGHCANTVVIWSEERGQTGYESSIAANLPGLIKFVLNSGQVHVMGEHPRPGTEDTYKYKTLLGLSDNRPVTIYADMSDGLRSVMIPKNLTNVSRVKPRLTLLQPTSMFPRSHDSFFYSKAPLEAVSRIRICRVEERITGMLLGYSNGSWTSLGSVDLDQLESAMDVDTCGLWIQSAQRANVKAGTASISDGMGSWNGGIPIDSAKYTIKASKQLQQFEVL
ncbi:hypothetical protein G3M48_000219 [Beauveria asiatica]|uniref:Uncharacterized protein n=1 Tax=Beauveria asiatica TaxID=1069075 RepID=A0AAW0S0Z7_9HYPO